MAQSVRGGTAVGALALAVGVAERGAWPSGRMGSNRSERVVGRWRATQRDYGDGGACACALRYAAHRPVP